MYNELQKNKLIDIEDKTPESVSIKARINRVMELVYYAKNVAISFKRIQEVSDLSRDFRDNTDASLFRFKSIDMVENTPYQNLLLYVLNYMYDKGYKRYNGGRIRSHFDEGWTQHSFVEVRGYHKRCGVRMRSEGGQL